jgi:hypothetical protein
MDNFRDRQNGDQDYQLFAARAASPLCIQDSFRCQNLITSDQRRCRSSWTAMSTLIFNLNRVSLFVVRSEMPRNRHSLRRRDTTPRAAKRASGQMRFASIFAVCRHPYLRYSISKPSSRISRPAGVLSGINHVVCVFGDQYLEREAQGSMRGGLTV